MTLELIVMSCGRNVEPYVEKHMESLKCQTFQNFKHIVVDDCSNDNTATQLMRYKGPNDIIHINTTRQYWIGNAMKYLKPHIITGEEIIVIADLDDWLVGPHVLQRVADEYERNTDAWMTYSRMFYVHANRTSHWIPPYTIQNLMEREFRSIIWSFTHLRTFKGFLWNQIQMVDLQDTKGKYYKYSWDRFVLYPCLELSAPHHIRFIPEVLYCYNDHQGQVERTFRKEQEDCARIAMMKPKYERLIR